MGFWYGIGAATAREGSPNGVYGKQRARKTRNSGVYRPLGCPLPQWCQEKSLFDDELNFGDQGVIVPARGIYRQACDIHRPAVTQKL